MGNAYLALKYTFAGKLYEAVFGAHTGTSTAAGQNTFTSADIDAWGFSNLGAGDLDARTDFAGGSYAPENLIEATISLLRAMIGPLAEIQQVYINDGFTLGTATGNFATFDTALPGVSTLVGTVLGNYAPANNTLMIAKTSGDFSRRGGRNFIRGALALSSITPTSGDGVTFATGTKVSYEFALNDVITTLGGSDDISVGSYLMDGRTGADGLTQVQLCIPRTKTVTVDGKTRRILDNWTRIQSIIVDDVQSRDTRRRNKKAVAS